MIAIVNVSKKMSWSKWNYYEVQVNDEVVGKFRHHPQNGLRLCLQLAAASVEKAEWEEGFK